MVLRNLDSSVSHSFLEMFESAVFERGGFAKKASSLNLLVLVVLVVSSVRLSPLTKKLFQHPVFVVYKHRGC